MTNTPIVNLGNPYLEGFHVTRTGNRTLTVGAGYARDFTNTNDMVVSSTIAVDLNVIGVPGIDTTIQANTTYVVTLVGDSTKFNSPTIQVGLLGGTPPSGYDIFRRVGIIRTDGSANVLQFYQYGWGIDKWVYYDVPIQVLSAGTSATFAAVSLASAVPNYTNGTLVKFLATFNPNAAGDIFYIRPTGSSSTDGIVRMSADAAAADLVTVFEAPCLLDTGVSSIDYKVTASGALTLSVIGYLDSLPVLNPIA